MEKRLPGRRKHSRISQDHDCQASDSNQPRQHHPLHLSKGENHESNAQAPNQYNISTFEETDTAFVLPSGPKPAEAPAARQARISEKQLSTRNLLYEAKSAD